MFLLGADFGENIAHRAGEDIDELVEKWRAEAERTAVADGAAEDAAEHIVPVGVARLNAVADGKGERADVVGDDAEGDIVFFLFGVASGTADRQRGSVGLAAEFFELVEDRAEDVGLVVRDARVGEIGEIICALDNRGDAFEAHAGIDMARGEGRERAIWVGIELDEDEIPNFDAVGGALVDERAARVTGGREIDMQLRAGAAGAGFTHHPEVVLLVTVHDVDGGIESDGAEFFSPDFPCLLVARGGVAWLGIVDRGVKAGGREFPTADDEFPGPVDRFLLEIISERPVAEHLEHGVVVGVETDIIEVVMFSTCPDAFLRIGGTEVGAGQRARPLGNIRRLLGEEKGNKLVHTSVRKKQVRRVGHEARGRNDCVLLLAEKIEERLADLSGCHS